MADNRDNRMDCPQCGHLWRVVGRSKESERYYRKCGHCGHKGVTGRNGAPPEPLKVNSIPCPQCHAPVWHYIGTHKKGTTKYHVCRTCGYKGTLDRATGKEVHKRGEWYRCPDCTGVTRTTKRRFGWEERTCECCGLACVREAKSDVVHRRAEWAKANPHRMPRDERPKKDIDAAVAAARAAKAADKAAKAAAYNLERAQRKAAKAEEKRAKAAAKAAHDRLLAQQRAVVNDQKKSKALRDHVDRILSHEQAKQRDARRAAEDRRMMRSLNKPDPLFG